MKLNTPLTQYATSNNTMLRQGLPYQGVLEKRWPGATFSFLYVYTLMSDILESPEEYLESPAETKDIFRFCEEDSAWTARAVSSARGHWLDISEEFVAQEFIRLLQGGSKYGQTYQI
ncbi:uncharacterized protein BDV17DRAFT_288347 [Aspergillus undulatus]|uniref:uncharacterized protein n=1 Tax=Aspergillus undulatus TaxID=1810928 RepID=UPI003CCD6BF5